MPFRDVALVYPERDLRVDGRRPADATAGKEGERLSVLQLREPERPPQLVRGLCLPAGEVLRLSVRSDLEEQHVASPLRELAGDDTAPGARPDDHDVVGVPHATPR